MADLFTRQQLLWHILCSHCSRQPMLRLSRSDDCYWISDLPRHAQDAENVREELTKVGFLVRAEENSVIWKIDLATEDELYHLPAVDVFAFPQQEEKHLLYALWRLLKKHPVPLDEQPMPLLRSVMKLSCLSGEEFARKTQQLYTVCAGRFNRKQPLPYSACGLLAQMIEKEETT